jgi:hypothetical protein
LPVPGRAVKDDAARQQGLERAQISPSLAEAVLALQQLEQLLAQAQLDLGVAADVALEVDVGQLDVLADGLAAQLAVDGGGLRAARERLAAQADGGEQPAQAHGVEARDVLVEREGVEALGVDRLGLALGDDLRQGLARDADDLALDREHALDHAGQREARVAKAQQHRLRVLVEQGDRLAGLHRQAGVRGRQHVEVQEHDDRALDAAADRRRQLAQHARQVAAALLFALGRAPVDDHDLRRALLAAAAASQSSAHRQVHVQRQLLVALDQHAHAPAQALLDVVDVLRAGHLDRILDAHVDRQRGDRHAALHGTRTLIVSSSSPSAPRPSCTLSIWPSAAALRCSASTYTFCNAACRAARMSASAAPSCAAAARDSSPSAERVARTRRSAASASLVARTLTSLAAEARAVIVRPSGASSTSTAPKLRVILPSCPFDQPSSASRSRSSATIAASGKISSRPTSMAIASLLDTRVVAFRQVGSGSLTRYPRLMAAPRGRLS